MGAVSAAPFIYARAHGVASNWRSWVEVATQVEPGSPQPLDAFHAWCQACVSFVLAGEQIPRLLFADGRFQEHPILASWEGEDAPLEPVEFAAEILSALAADTTASQLGICVPFGGDEPGLYLVTCDETGSRVDRALVEMTKEGTTFKRWERVDPILATAETYELLARKARYRQFSKWRCRRCGSVCCGEADEPPTSCEFCGSTAVEGVPLDTPLAPPRPPYDVDYVHGENARIAPAFLQMLRLIVDGSR